MIVLGIESTAHTFAVALLKDKVVLSNEKALFATTKGGMIPSRVADHHVELCDEVLLQALKKARIEPYQIDLISYSRSPGIGHSLRIGASMAKSLSLQLNKPLLGVNHCVAHLEIGKMRTHAQDPVLLYASGANTQIIAFEANKYRVFGETLDIGIGNFLDNFGRLLGLGFPSGPQIEQLAQKGSKLITLPYSVKGMDVSFAGMLTKLQKMIESNDYRKEDLCFSVQETSFAMLLEVAERALAHCSKKELLLGGGVACNKRLQDMAALMCEERGAKFFCPEKEFLVDNAAMIAWLGLVMYQQGNRLRLEQASIDPYERTDEVIFKLTY